MPTATETIPEDEMRAALEWAMEHVEITARRRGRDMEEALIDSATDSVMWAVRSYDPARGAFGPFSAAAVKRAVRLAVIRFVQERQQRPEPAELPESLAASRRQSSADSLTIEDLPEDLAFAVRLYFVDGYDLRECGALMGCDKNAVQRKLRKAAELLAPGRVAPVRKAGARRLDRTKPDREPTH